MLFNSLHFLLFFPIVTIIYFIFPSKWRYIWLLATSYYFYMCWNAKYIIIIFASTLITYIGGMLIDRCNKRGGSVRQKKIWVALVFVINLAILIFFKYFNFLYDSIEIVFNTFEIVLNQPTFNIVLPVGISFYTFQALGYIIDVYRKDTKVEKNFLRYALFVSYFPQLVAGPIERSKNLLSQLREGHKFKFENARNGFLMMLWGMFQKIVIADRAAILVNEVFNNYTNYAGFQIVVAAVMFAVQIYCDFGGYSNIAIGAAQVIGINLMKNFRQPYLALSIKDFWRRWHISLSTWFRDYLYIPLGGSRKGRIQTYTNTLIVFVLSGLWHGASWNFVLWGVIHGSVQILSDLTKSLRSAFANTMRINTQCFSYRLFQRLWTFCIVDFAWIFFRANSTYDAMHIVRRLFSDFNFYILFEKGGLGLFNLGMERQDFQVLIIAIAVLFGVDYLHERKISLREKLYKQNIVFRWGVYYAVIFFILIFGIYGPGYNASQFIYFQF